MRTIRHGIWFSKKVWIRDEFPLPREYVLDNHRQHMAEAICLKNVTQCHLDLDLDLMQIQGIVIQAIVIQAIVESLPVIGR
jgi:hypothetical protein